MLVNRENTKEEAIIMSKRNITSKNIEKKIQKINPVLSDGARVKMVSNTGTI